VQKCTNFARDVQITAMPDDNANWGRYLGIGLEMLAGVLLGYFLGESWWVAERWIGRVGAIAAGVVLAGVLLWIRQARRAPS